MNSKQPLSLAFAIPDHPWVEDADGAAVRIAMTVAEPGVNAGVLVSIQTEIAGTGNESELTFNKTYGLLHADLRVGANVSAAKALLSNCKLSNRGFCLFGAGFLVSHEDATKIAASDVGDEARHPIIFEYRNGRDLTDRSRNLKVIDAFGLTSEELRSRYPAAYQWLFERVKPERDSNKRESRRENWWVFGEPNKLIRQQLLGLHRYIVTVETSKHRVFQFLDSSIAPDNMLVVIASSDAFHLGVLSSLIHVVWALAAGGRLGVGNDPRYNKSRCFEPFPFPLTSNQQQEKIRSIAEQIDSHRKNQQAKHPTVTITGVYNVLEKLKTGEALNAKEKEIHDQGLVSVLKQLHDELDVAVLEAYGWSDLAPLMKVLNGSLLAHHISPSASRDDIKRELEEALLEKLVALNSQRLEDERKGFIHWLRPELQSPHGAVAVNSIDEQAEMYEETDAPIAISIEKQPWPRGDLEQVKAVADLIAATKSPMDLESVTACFSGKGQWKRRLPNILEMLVVVGKARVDERGYLPV
jgi:hypothetical protein